MAKAWRLNAVKGSTPSARVAKAQQQAVDKLLNRGIKTNWLLSGLFIHAGISKPQ
jgi:hypothetical protein